MLRCRLEAGGELADERGLLLGLDGLARRSLRPGDRHGAALHRFREGGTLPVLRHPRSLLLGLRHELRLAAALGFGSGCLEVLSLAAHIASGAYRLVRLLDPVETALLIERENRRLGGSADEEKKPRAPACFPAALLA